MDEAQDTALFLPAGDVALALGLPVTTQARFLVVFRKDQAEGLFALLLGHGGDVLAFRMGAGLELVLDDVIFPFVRAIGAVTHVILGGR